MLGAVLKRRSLAAVESKDGTKPQQSGLEVVQQPRRREKIKRLLIREHGQKRQRKSDTQTPVFVMYSIRVLIVDRFGLCSMFVPSIKGSLEYKTKFLSSSPFAFAACRQLIKNCLLHSCL